MATIQQKKTRLILGILLLALGMVQDASASEYSYLWRPGKPFVNTNFIYANATTYPPGTITGRITDEAGNGLAGVTVMVKGTSTSVLTDEDGRYSIKAPEKATLVLSYVGYDTQEMLIDSRACAWQLCRLLPKAKII